MGQIVTGGEGGDLLNLGQIDTGEGGDLGIFCYSF